MVTAQTAVRLDRKVRYPQGSLDVGPDLTLVFTGTPPATPPLFGWWLRCEGRHSDHRNFLIRVRLGASRHEISLEWPRGEYEVQVRWELVDAFGLTRLHAKALWTTTVWVPPTALPFSPPRPPAARPGPWTPRRTGRRAGDPFDVRRYVPGDDLRRLHWPLYAHAGNLFVRTSEPTPPPTGHQFVVLDTEAASEEDLDGRLGRLATWLLLLGAQGTGWTVAVPATDEFLDPSTPWEKRLAALSPEPLPDGPVPPSWPATVVLVTGPTSSGAARLASRLEAARRRFQPVFIPAPPVQGRRWSWWRRP